MKAIRASDIGTYLYCHRAWYYRLHGQESLNQDELAAGTELHRAHGRKVISAGLYRALGLLLLLAALVLLTGYLTLSFLK
jgi:CRISPR/Cas system-associated exonuclease Cas4 (RecB family)